MTGLFEPLARSERRLLEIGSSAGLAARVARELEADVVAVGAFEELPFPPRSFDCVVAAPMLSDPAVEEVRRVLYEDGQLVAVAPQSQWLLLRHFTVVECRGGVFVCTP